MGWLNLRVLLAHLLPGFAPTLVFFATVGDEIDLRIFGSGADLLTLYLLSSVAMGIIVDLIKRRVQPIIIKWANLWWIPYLGGRLMEGVLGRPSTRVPLRVTADRYEAKLRAAVELWLRLRLQERPDIVEEAKQNVLLEKEYLHPTITAGDWWALLTIRENPSLRFYLDEYFTFYEFSSNALVSLLVTEVLAAVLWFNGYLDPVAWRWLLVGGGILIVLFEELSVFWFLATRRITRKILLYSVLNDSADRPSE